MTEIERDLDIKLYEFPTIPNWCQLPDKKDRGTILSKWILESIKNMTTTEYRELFESLPKPKGNWIDIKERKPLEGNFKVMYQIRGDSLNKRKYGETYLSFDPDLKRTSISLLDWHQGVLETEWKRITHWLDENIIELPSGIVEIDDVMNSDDMLTHSMKQTIKELKSE